MKRNKHKRYNNVQTARVPSFLKKIQLSTCHSTTIKTTLKVDLQPARVASKNVSRATTSVTITTFRALSLYSRRPFRISVCYIPDRNPHDDAVHKR